MNESKQKNEIKISLGLAIFLVILIMAVISLIIYIIVNKQQNESEKENNTQFSITNNTNSNSNEKQQVGDYFILYDGYEMQKTATCQYLYDMDYTRENEQKYNITYFNYENSKYKGEKQGKVEMTYGNSEEEYDGVCVVQNVNRIAISEKYNAIPREVKREQEIPKELQDMLDYPSLQIDSVDLDGDGTEEHIVCWRVVYRANEIGDGKPEESSGIMLFDSKYNKIADIATLENGFWGNSLEMSSQKDSNITEDQLDESRIYFDLGKTEYIDIDNDGKMEVIVNIPVYEGININVLKYDDGKITGKTDIKANVGGGKVQ